MPRLFPKQPTHFLSLLLHKFGDIYKKFQEFLDLSSLLEYQEFLDLPSLAMVEFSDLSLIPRFSQLESETGTISLFDCC